MQKLLGTSSHLRISDGFGGTYFRLLDMSDCEMVAAVGSIAMDVPPDIYRVQAIRPGGFVERVIRTRSGKTTRLTNFAPPFDAPTPLANCASASQQQQLAAERTSRLVHVREGEFNARLFLFGRRMGEPPERDNRPSFILRDTGNHVYGSELGEMNEKEGWFAETLDVPPGIYTLEYEVPDLGRRAQLLSVDPGWETQIFFPLHGGTSDFAHAWMHQRPVGTGFDPSDPNNLYQSMGGVLEAFVDNSAVFKLDLPRWNQLCKLGSKDPMIALMVAYLLLSQGNISEDYAQQYAQLYMETVGQLSTLLPSNPDAALLRIAPFGRNRPLVFTSPRNAWPWLHHKLYGVDTRSEADAGNLIPCFARGLEILLTLATGDSTLLAHHSAMDIVLRRTTGSIWTRWNAEISPHQAREQAYGALLEASTNSQNSQSSEDLARDFTLPLALVKSFVTQQNRPVDTATYPKVSKPTTDVSAQHIRPSRISKENFGGERDYPEIADLSNRGFTQHRADFSDSRIGLPSIGSVLVKRSGVALVNVSTLQSLVGLRVNIFPHLYAEVVAPGSSAYEEARQLQLERFASTVTSGPYAGDPYLQGQAYLQVTEYAPERTVPIVIRTTDYALDNEDRYPPDTLVGAARLELSGATFIESIIRLQPHSLARRALDDGHVAEIGGFTTPKDLKKSLLLDVLDTLAAAVMHVSAGLGIEWLWLQPRVGFMSLVCATIPDLLPPYHFTYSLDVAGWNEESEQLQKYRLLGQKGEENFPEIYQIHQATLETDLESRVRLWLRRDEHRQEMKDLLFRAMWRAHHQLMRDPVRVSAKARFAVSPQLSSTALGHITSHANIATGTQLHREHTVDMPVQPEHLQVTRFAFTGSTSADVTYLRALRRDGDSAIQGYKDLSYDLLELEPGMTILDVGCGDGTDVQILSMRVGPQGHAIGVENKHDLVAHANNLLRAGGYQNATVFYGNAEHLTFPNDMFDRVRADRSVQHFQHPSSALAEMWRVLRPGGILTIIEPDWGAIALDPASVRGGNDDATFMHVMKWVRRHIPQALIGRQLSGMLRRIGNWSKVEVFVHSLCTTDWPVIDAALELSKSAGLAAAAAPERKPEIDAWLEQVHAAAATGTFFAAVPLFFAYARK